MATTPASGRFRGSAICVHAKPAGVNAGNTDIEDRLLTGFSDRLVELLLRFAHYFFDTARVDTAIGDQFFQRQSRDFAPDRIVP